MCIRDSIKRLCPDVKHVVIIFNPADITGLVTMLHAGIDPRRVTTLAALDSTRLQSELAKHFGVAQSEVTGARTFGGHGEDVYKRQPLGRCHCRGSSASWSYR